MSWGFVYILWNESMPGLYKIGRTSRSPSARAEELSAASGVPTPFSVAFYAESNDHEQLEIDIHSHFAACRVNDGREFFAIESLLEAFAFLVWHSYSQCLVSEEVLIVSGEVSPGEDFNFQDFICDVRRASLKAKLAMKVVSK